MLVQGPTSILISNYHLLTKKKYYNFLSPFFNIFQRKINIFEDFNHHQMVVFCPLFYAISSHISLQVLNPEDRAQYPQYKQITILCQVHICNITRLRIVPARE